MRRQILFRAMRSPWARPVGAAEDAVRNIDTLDSAEGQAFPVKKTVMHIVSFIVDLVHRIAPKYTSTLDSSE